MNEYWTFDPLDGQPDQRYADAGFHTEMTYRLKWIDRLRALFGLPVRIGFTMSWKQNPPNAPFTGSISQIQVCETGTIVDFTETLRFNDYGCPCVDDPPCATCPWNPIIQQFTDLLANHLRKNGGNPTWARFAVQSLLTTVGIKKGKPLDPEIPNSNTADMSQFFK